MTQIKMKPLHKYNKQEKTLFGKKGQRGYYKRITRPKLVPK